MENKAHALAAGIFVLVLAALLAGLAAWLTRDTGSYDSYEISTRETITGLQAQAPVRYRGVDVGKVASIGFDEKARGNVLIRLNIDTKAPVTADTFASLGFQGVTGLSFVQLDDEGKGGPRLEAGSDGAAPRIPLKPGIFSNLQAKSEKIVTQIDEITVRLNTLLADPNQKRLVDALDGVGQAAASVGALSNTLTAIFNAQLGPDRVSIPAFVANANKALGSVGAVGDEARKTLAEINKTTQRLNAQGGPVDRLADGAQALSAAADSFNAATLPRINRATEDTSRAVRQLSRTVNGINDNPQSLIFGGGAVPPGPGEAGFAPPAAATNAAGATR